MPQDAPDAPAWMDRMSDGLKPSIDLVSSTGEREPQPAPSSWPKRLLPHLTKRPDASPRHVKRSSMAAADRKRTPTVCTLYCYGFDQRRPWTPVARGLHNVHTTFTGRTCFARPIFALPITVALVLSAMSGSSALICSSICSRLPVSSARGSSASGYGVSKGRIEQALGGPRKAAKSRRPYRMAPLRHLLHLNRLLSRRT